MATVVGDRTFINGNLTGDEDLTVHGRVKGTIQIGKSLIVEPTGVVEAEVNVANAVVSGVVVGNITATDSVEILKGGRMVGDIAAPRVIITDGALFRGGIDMGEVKADESGLADARARAAAAKRGGGAVVARPARAATPPRPAPRPATARAATPPRPAPRPATPPASGRASDSPSAIASAAASTGAGGATSPSAPKPPSPPGGRRKKILLKRR
jgi:cytoskeletal protein CcmA (bactofilin family)